MNDNLKHTNSNLLYGINCNSKTTTKQNNNYKLRTKWLQTGLKMNDNYNCVQISKNDIEGSTNGNGQWQKLMRHLIQINTHLLGCFKSFIRFYESSLNCNISVNTYSI